MYNFVQEMVHNFRIMVVWLNDICVVGKHNYLEAVCRVPDYP